MQTSSKKPKSVARKLALLSIAIIATMLFLLAMGIGLVSGRAARQQVQESVAEKIQGIANAMAATDKTQRALIQRSFKTLQHSFEATMSLDEASGELKSYGTTVNNQFGDVDAFTASTGAVATIFARKGDDFLRVTTSVKKQDGERALGTLLERSHPAYKAMLAGQPYTGQAMLFGKHFMTHYEPLKDAQGKIIGILFVGNDISLVRTALDAQVTETRFFGSGGVYVVDPRSGAGEAVFVVHPTAIGKKLVEVSPRAAAFVEELVAAADGRVDDATPLLDGKSPDRWALMRKVTDGSWWVVAELSHAESTRQHWNNMAIIWGLMALATVLLGLALFAVVRRMVSQPLSELTTVVKAVADGDLTHSFGSERDDEIGALVHEVEGMRQRYQTALSQVRASVDSIGTASAEIASGNQDLSARTEQTASNLQRTASSMELLTATAPAEYAQEAIELIAIAGGGRALPGPGLPAPAPHHQPPGSRR